MYLIETYFRLTELENNIESQSRLLNAVIDQWRYNGQIIGREIPLYLAEEDGAQGFAMRVICPEQDSLFPQNNNAEVNRALQEAEKCGVIFDGFQLVGDDFNSDQTAENVSPTWQVLYTTHLQSCSPIHSGKHGRYLAQEIEKETGIPTYYYLYRVGGQSLESEKSRCCPSCGANWMLKDPIFDTLHFKCDTCRLVSNLSWNFL